MNPTPTDPRIERTRSAVTEAAGGLLLTEGPDAITHGRVAAAADVSRTTVYKHWPERADLLRATIDGFGETVPQAVAFTGDLRADLRTLLAGLATKLNDESHVRVITMMMERAQHDSIAAGVRDVVYREIHDAFDHLLTVAASAGHVRVGIDTHRAVASVGGSLLFSRLLANRIVDDELLDGVIDDFVTANAPDAGPPGAS